MTTIYDGLTTNTAGEPAGATTRDIRSFREYRQEPQERPAWRTRPMVDPRDPDSGRVAVREYREQIGRAMTEEIASTPDLMDRIRKSVRHAEEGDLRPLSEDT
jgi:ribosome-binding protein aMBF1 (putative translation factor)